MNDGIRERRSVSVFNDTIPKKEIIDKILEESTEHYPKKCSVVYHKVKVFGPEFYEDKRKIFAQTTCDPMYSSLADTPEKIAHIIEESKEWLDLYLSNPTKKEMLDTFGADAYQPEILAPYVLIFYDKSEKTGAKNSESYNYLSSSKSHDRALQSSAMHGIITACIATEYGISSSFLGSIPLKTEFNQNAISDFIKTISDVVLILCLGYPDEKSKWNPKYRRPIDEKIIEW